MLKYTQNDVTLEGVKIHYYRTGGAKPPFILLHGATDNGLCWTPIAEWLSAQYDVIMPDAQGHGLSARFGPDYSFDAPTDQVAGLVKELGLKKPLIMGHSMGAGTTTNVAVKYPSLPRAIILEDPGWMPQEAMDKVDPQRVPPRESLMKVLAGYQNKTAAEIKAEGHKLNPRWSEAELEPWAPAKLQADPTMFSRPLLNPAGYTELVPKIKCPTLLIISDGGIVPVAAAQNAAKIWKSKQPFKWVLIKGAGHNIRREQTEAFKEAVSSFLKALPA
ncbi:MAG: alpha/beta hydrolase [Dehalococcoidales bacterium]|jgi:pimeloyl-ACP methyl ester carboxylesterase